MLLACITLFPPLASAYDVLVLLSSREPEYRENLNGFSGGSSASRQVIVLSDFDQVDVVRIVREERPKLVLAIGDAALAAAAAIRETPVVAVLAYDLHKLKDSRPNLIGIEMYAPPEQYISIFQKMKTTHVGVIHNPAASNWYLQQAGQEADSAGIMLFPRDPVALGTADQVLSNMPGGSYALWILPDGSNSGQKTVETAVSFARKHAIPVVSFSTGHLPLGAIAALEIDRTALGQQAASLVAVLLRQPGGLVRTTIYPNVISSKANPVELKYLGSTFKGELPAE